MKTLLKNILLLAVILGTYTSYAKDNVDTPKSYNYVKKGNLISVTDAFGEQIYNGEINHNGNLTTLFDFTQLKNGKYTVEISKDFEIEVNTIVVENNVVSILNAKRKTIFKPVVRNENGKILISKLIFDTEETNIELYFEGDLIYSETVQSDEILNRVYKLDKTLKGIYSTVIRANGRVFVKNFSI